MAEDQRELLFLRHGKSDWNASFDHDHERPINERGRKASRRIGQFLSDGNGLPDRIVCSTAVRARMTLDEARAGGRWADIECEFTDELYEASIRDVLEVIRRTPDTVRSLLLVGHEPTWSSMVARLVARDGAMNLKFPTAGLACVRVEDESWREVEVGNGVLLWLVVPKTLG